MYLTFTGMDLQDLKEKGKELWDQIVKLETEKYDLEEKVKRQDYDVSSSIPKALSIYSTYHCS